MILKYMNDTEKNVISILLLFLISMKGSLNFNRKKKKK